MRGALLLATGAPHANELIDLRVFKPPVAESRRIASPTVRWWTRENPEFFCATVPEKDGFSMTRGGCVYWQIDHSTCTLVTGHSTTHSVLGHLLLQCFQAGAEP